MKNKKYRTFGTVPNTGQSEQFQIPDSRNSSKYRTVGTVPNVKRKLLERDKIDTPNIKDLHLFTDDIFIFQTFLAMKLRKLYRTDFKSTSNICCKFSIFILIITWSEWLLLNANSTIFQLYHGENKLIFNKMTMRSDFHWNNSPRIDMFPHSDTLPRFRANQSLL
jgi:hypothetical protein